MWNRLSGVAKRWKLLHPPLTVLVYHSVLPRPDPVFPERFHAGMFARQLAILRRYYCVLPLGEALQKLERGTLPRRAVSITFDDGYADNFEVALPMLLERKMHATFFVAPGYLDGGIMFNDIVRECVSQASHFSEIDDLLGNGVASTDVMSHQEVFEAVIRKVKYQKPGARESAVRKLAKSLGVELPTDIMMTSAQVRSLAEAGMEIGAHTMTHPILSQVPFTEARKEVLDSKNRLEDIVESEVRLFAYPNGIPGKDYLADHVAIVEQAGFSASFTTSNGVVRSGMDKFQLPRFGPWSTDVLKYFVNQWRNSRASAQFVART